VTLFWQFDGNEVGSLGSCSKFSIGLPIVGKLGRGMKEVLQCCLVSLLEVLELEVVGIGGKLSIFPAIHDLIGVLSIIGSELPIDKLGLRDFIIGWSIPAELGLDEKTVASAIPGHVALFVGIRHAK
jgi:hypothetical protein